ncbi:toll/interleukin-1 receptor domain-containing protein [Actinoplanes sp. NPDC051851]|uniref:toll/interleukin-1 receptor domain-containing protein n=1 Tax=Actinoplanes sp. NPDC051851 TaxID=3154753 RepID=UPI00343098F3
MEETLRSPWDYDAFISYTRFDNHIAGIVTAVIRELRRQFRRLSGHPFRTFLDEEDISISTIWQDRLELALERSAVLIIFVTPSYLTSGWCAREFDKFSALEEHRRIAFGLAPHQSLVFPITVTEVTLRGGEPPGVEERYRRIRGRQAVDLTSCKPGSTAFTTAIERLARDLRESLQQLIPHDRPASANHVPDFATADQGVPIVATHSGTDRERLTRLLADAESTIIVGVTNSWLPECLEAAIHIKRQRPSGKRFWDDLQIVFLAEEVLPFVKDELSTEFPIAAQALRERVRRAGQAKRHIMSLLLREGAAGRWSLHSYPFALPFTGNIFVFRDGHRRVQLGVTRPMRGEDDSLRIDFLDRFDQSFEAAFREIVENSREEHELVLVGSPGSGPDRFLCRSVRFRRSVLEGGGNASDWLPAVVVLTWRIGTSGPEALLQVNTPTNSTREMGKVSHVSGYINQVDHVDIGHGAGERETFEISWDEATAAAHRELRTDFGITETPMPPERISAVPFYYCDKENFLFYMLSQQLDASTSFGEHTRMFAWAPADLMRIRGHQVLRGVLRLFGHPMAGEQRRRATALVLNNLIAHEEDAVAQSLSRHAELSSPPDSLKELVTKRLQATAYSKYARGREIQVTGIAGLQYRAFFSHILPAYTALRIQGAGEILTSIHADRDRAEAVAALSVSYLNEDYITSFPMEV